MTDSRGRTNNRRNHDDVAGRLARPLKIFAKHKLAGAILLLVATVTAVLAANSQWAHVYSSLGGLQFALPRGLDHDRLDMMVLGHGQVEPQSRTDQQDERSASPQEVPWISGVAHEHLD